MRIERLSYLLILLIAAPAYLHAQWVAHRDPTIPRTRDGKPNLAAPAPRVNGKPDLSGIWQSQSPPAKDIQQFLLPGGINGLGEDLPPRDFFNVLADFPRGQEPLQPAAREAFEQRSQHRERPMTLCSLPSLPQTSLMPAPYKIVQTPKLMILLYEGETVFRQIFSDGRELPQDPTPSWLGYSIGKWDGDTFVAETVGFNDKATLDAMGHPRSESMRLIERFRRRDFGHLEVEVTIDDPKTYTKPVTFRVENRLLPDTELIEYFCNENEKDLGRLR